MTQHEIVTGVLVDDVTLTLEEAAQACGVEPQWIVERVEAGFLGDGSVQMTYWRFASDDLTRARRMRQLESAFDAVPELAALVVDLQEEVARLRRRIGSV